MLRNSIIITVLLILCLMVTLVTTGCSTAPTPELDPVEDPVDTTPHDLEDSETLIPQGEHPSGNENDDDTSNSTTTSEYDFSAYMGTWYYTPYTDFERTDIKPMTIEKTGSNTARASFEGTVIDLTFVSPNRAEGPISYHEDAYGKNRGSRLVFEFTTSHGADTIFINPIYVDNGDYAAQGSSAYRSVDDFFIGTPAEESAPAETTSDSGTSLSEEQAQEALAAWIGDLGTWQDGEPNVLVPSGKFTVNGKDYYQFRLRGWVDNHATTLTWYVISADGTDIFEGQCNNGSLNRW